MRNRKLFSLDFCCLQSKRKKQKATEIETEKQEEPTFKLLQKSGESLEKNFHIIGLSTLFVVFTLISSEIRLHLIVKSFTNIFKFG